MRTIMVLLLALCASSAMQAQSLLYGYRLTSSANQGFVSFSSDNPATLTQLNTYREFDSFRGDYNRITAGEFVKGDYYSSSMYGTSAEYAGAFTRLSTDTWETLTSRRLNPNSDIGGKASLADMAYDYSTKTLYGLSAYNATDASLFIINQETLTTTPVCVIHPGLVTLAINLAGTAYGIGRNGMLYTIDKSNGTTQEVGPTGITFLNPGTQSMAFNHVTGKLYWTVPQLIDAGSLYEINPATGAATRINRIGTGVDIAGLYAPYYNNLNIPAAPSNLTVTPAADGALSAILNWTNPDQARSGNNLSRLSSIVVERNGQVVYTLNNPVIGAAVSWTDIAVPAADNYEYTVYGVTDGDKGARSRKYVFVGSDPCMLADFPYTVSFESDADLACFTSIYYNDANEPIRSDETARSGNYSWRFSSRNGPYESDFNQYLISPQLAASDAEKTIRFYYNTLTYDTEQFWVGYSTSDTDLSHFTWVDHIVPRPGTNGWIEYFKVLPPETKYIAIRYYVMYRWNVYIDDMTIDVLADKDASLQAVTAPVTAPGLTANETVRVSVRNMGTETLSNIPIRMEVDGAAPVEETVPGPIAKLATVPFTFQTKADLSALGRHNLKISLLLQGDKRPDNNSQTVSLTNYGDCVYSLPFTESFEEASALTCWTIHNAQSNRPARSKQSARNGEYAMRFASDTYNDNRDYNQYLITPKLATSTVQKKLQFFYQIPRQTTIAFRVGYVSANISPDNVAWADSIRWRTDLTLTEDGASQWREINHVFPANTKYIVFNYIGLIAGSGALYIDDVNVRDVSDIDMAVTDIVKPFSYGDLEREYVTIRVKNTGQTPVSNIPVKYEVDGVGIGAETINVSLAPEASILHTFATRANLSQAKTYTIKAYINGLAADDAKDNDTISVQVTNYGACKIDRFPYEFGFEEPLTACWANYDLDGDIYRHQWTRVNTASHSGSYSMMHDAYLDQDAILVMPKAVLQANHTYFLSFWSANTTYDSGKNSVWISKGSPRPEDGEFEEVWKQTGQTYNWEQSTISLYDYAGETIYIAFRYQGNTAHTWYLDDVSIYEVSGKSGGVTAITSPSSNSGLGMEPVSVKIKNFGGEALTNIPVKLDVDGQNIAAETVPDSLKPNAETIYTFQAKADLSEAKTHQVKAYTAVPGETHPEKSAATAYITNLGPCEVTSFPYKDGFERTDDLNVDYFICWTPYDLDGNPNTSWEIVSSFTADSGSRLYPRNGNKMALHDYYVASSSQNDWLVSSRISIPATGAYGLTFWSFNAYTAGYGKNSLLISTGSSNPRDGKYVELWSPKSVNASWEKTTVNLADYAGKDVYIAFRYQGRDAHAWLIDDISIAMLPDNDVGVSKIISPVAGGNKEAPVTIELTNYGANTIQSIKAAYQLNEQEEVERRFDNLNLASGKTVTLTFPQTVDVKAYDWYAFSARTLLEADTDTGNDRLSIRFRHREDITLYGYQLDFYGAISRSQLKGVSFQVSNPEETEKEINDYHDGSNVITAGEYYNGSIYLYSRYSSGSSWMPGNFIRLTADGVQTSKSTATDMPDDMTYDYSTNTMYAITGAFGGLSELKTVDLTTGATTPVQTLDRVLRTLACDSTGKLYGIDQDGVLCIINKQTGRTTEVGSIPVRPADDLQSMTFDQLSGDLYWASYDALNDGRLFDVHLTQPEKSIDLGYIGQSSQIVALFSLYPRHRVDIAAPTVEQAEIVIYPNPAKEQVHISSIPEGAVINLLDVSGRIVQSRIAESDQITLNLNLSKGVYFVQVQSKDTQTVRKLIVK